MAKHSGSGNKSGSERDRKSGSNTQSGSSPQMHSGQSKGSTRSSGEMGPMHTNAGSTGFSSDQISPKTQNLPQTGPSASHPGRNKGSSGGNR